MGRYYTGDIEGKFVFGSQSSTAADRFGVSGQEPGYLDYHYDAGNLEELQSELSIIEDEFGEHKTALKTYYDLHKDEDDAELSFSEYIKLGGLLPLDHIQQLEYNDYRIGRKILQCINDNGSCSFTAEL
jgi:hypothetical protein